MQDVLISILKEHISEDFTVEAPAVVCAEPVDLYAFFSRSEDKTNIFSMKAAGQTLCSEHCMYLATAIDDESQLRALFAYADKCIGQLVEAENPDHTFTFISLVVLTEHFPPALEKILKKYKNEQEYRKNQFGWSSVRFCVADLGAKKLYTNKLGSALADRFKPAAAALFAKI